MFDDSDIFTGAPGVDDLLAEPITGGGDILVGAPDPDLLGLSELTTAGMPVVGGGGDILTGWDGLPVVGGGGDILTGWDGMPVDETDIFTGAPMTAAQRMAQQRRLAQQRAAQQRAAQQRAAQQRAAQQRVAQQRAAQQRAAQVAAAQRQAQANALAAAQAAQNLGTRAMVTPMQDEKYRRQPLPVDSESDVGAGATRSIKVQAQVRCKPARFVIENPEWWRIRAIYVGNKPQFAAAGALPGIYFRNDSVGGNLIGDTAQIGQDILVEVENKTGAPHRFEGVLECHTVD